MKKPAEYIYGLHSVGAMLTRNAPSILDIYVQKDNSHARLTEWVEMARKQGITVQSADKAQLDKLTSNGNHQGIVARIKSEELPGEAELSDLLDTLTGDPFLLLLDEVQDPHNLGACLRTAAAAGIDAVILPRSHSVGLTPVVRKVASGAAEILPIFSVTNLARCMRQLQERGIWLMGAAATGSQNIYNTPLTGPLGIVMGNEGSGLRRLTSEHCDLLINIPMSDAVPSLNVSVATGICLFESRRQRGWN